MVKKSKKSKSKRVTLKKKYKVIKKVKEHHKKKAKESKKLGLNKKKKVEKDPGIPNDWPFKEQELKALEARRARAIEELEQKKASRKERAKKRKLGLLENDDMTKLVDEASARTEEFEKRINIEEQMNTNAGSHDHSERSFHKELVKVIEASDVILEVLDARDPLGSRSLDMEKLVYKSDPTKRVVLLLNKIDLVPREAVEKWLTYLRQELPAVAFKCNTQEQRSNLGRKSAGKAAKTNITLSASDCLGAETLIKLLKNYSRSHEMKMSITVGIVGLPNVGKSSLINSLKGSHVVNVGSTPGLTRSLQEVQLDKKVKLLDCPGVVMLKSDHRDTSLALRNCKRIEKLADPIGPVKEILNLCPADAEKLISLYKVPSFSSVDDFLQKVASLRGKLKKGGIVDTDAAARIVLHDWNEGKIPYYTLPPSRNVDTEMSSVKIISELGKEFDVDEVYKFESSFIGGLASVEDLHHLVVPSCFPVRLDDSPSEEGKIEIQEETESKDLAVAEYLERRAASSAQNDKLYTADSILDPRKKRAEKKRRKEKKLSLMNSMDADYDFKVDYFKKMPTSEEAGAEGSEEDGEALVAAPMSGIELDA